MEIIHTFGLLLLMIAPAIVSQQLSGFIKRARLRHAFSFALMVSGFACSTQIATAPDRSTEAPSVIPNVPYPNPVESHESVEDDVDPWRCGYEWIVIEGPDGELIISQIPLECDPHTDVYMGCPMGLDAIGDK